VFEGHSHKEGTALAAHAGAMVHIEAFLYLQLLDFLTTLVGLQVGLAEASPFIDWLMQLGPAFGLAASKLLAVILGGACIWLNKRHVIRWINYWYAGLVVWNMCLIFGAVQAI
jgi:hypothetical protein